MALVVTAFYSITSNIKVTYYSLQNETVDEEQKNIKLKNGENVIFGGLGPVSSIGRAWHQLIGHFTIACSAPYAS